MRFTACVPCCVPVCPLRLANDVALWLSQVNTVFAADAVARISGVPGVAAVTAGPGVTNTVTAIKNAQMAQSPVVLLGGAAATLLKGKGSLQDIDQMAVLSPIVKYAVACTTVREIVPALRKAFQEAASGVPGGCDSVITSTLLAAVSLLLSVFSVE